MAISDLSCWHKAESMCQLFAQDNKQRASGTSPFFQGIQKVFSSHIANEQVESVYDAL